eukprot:698822-Pleurochrysis_carterae.AAC.1
MHEVTLRIRHRHELPTLVPGWQGAKLLTPVWHSSELFLKAGKPSLVESSTRQLLRNMALA